MPFVIPAFLKSLTFQIGGTLALLAVVVSSCVARDHRIASTARVEERQEIVQAAQENGKKANAQSEKVRAAVKQPGAAQRLRADVCRDC